MRLLGAVLLEQNDEWQLQHRYMQAEATAEFTTLTAEVATATLPPTGPCPVPRRDIGAADRAA